MTFDPNPYMIKLKGKDYLPVAPRIAWMRSEHPEWGIVTEEVEVTENTARFRATVFNDAGRVVATATKCEDVKGFADFVEKAETGSVGRALALCGYGTLQCLELEEGARLADSPVARQQNPVPQPAQSATGVQSEAVKAARAGFYAACAEHGVLIRETPEGKVSPPLVMNLLAGFGWVGIDPPATVRDWEASTAKLLESIDNVAAMAEVPAPAPPPSQNRRNRQPSPPPDMTPEELADPFMGEEATP